jgi:hypothetical protein
MSFGRTKRGSNQGGLQGLGLSDGWMDGWMAGGTVYRDGQTAGGRSVPSLGLMIGFGGR